jgi:hypothetical protein
MSKCKLLTVITSLGRIVIYAEELRGDHCVEIGVNEVS